MLKVKRLRTADCVVGGFRYETGTREVGSMLLGLYNKDGKLDHVGFTSTISDKERPALTKQLQALIEPPGFTGKAPGGPSRWSTERSGEWEPVEPKIVVEVRYDQVTGDRFRHGTRLVRFRPDKAPRQCTFEQIEPPAMPKDVKRLLGLSVCQRPASRCRVLGRAWQRGRRAAQGAAEIFATSRRSWSAGEPVQNASIGRTAARRYDPRHSSAGFCQTSTQEVAQRLLVQGKHHLHQRRAGHKAGRQKS